MTITASRWATPRKRPNSLEIRWRALVPYGSPEIKTYLLPILVESLEDLFLGGA